MKLKSITTTLLSVALLCSCGAGKVSKAQFREKVEALTITAEYSSIKVFGEEWIEGDDLEDENIVHYTKADTYESEETVYKRTEDGKYEDESGYKSDIEGFTIKVAKSVYSDDYELEEGETVDFYLNPFKVVLTYKGEDSNEKDNIKKYTFVQTVTYTANEKGWFTSMVGKTVYNVQLVNPVSGKSSFKLTFFEKTTITYTK